MQIKTVPFAVHDAICRVQPDRVVFEVGASAGRVHDVVTAFGVEVQVANPNHEGWRWRNVKRKTDRLDALKLAKLSAVDQLPLVHMPDRCTREHRALIAYRGKLVSRRTRIKNTVRSLVQRQGRSLHPGPAGWTRASLSRLGGWSHPVDQADGEDLWRGQLHEELTALEQVERRIVRLEAKLDALGQADERIQRLQTIPCVGPRTAEMLVVVIDDPHRFRSGKEVGSHVGLVPRQYQSGQMDRTGRLPPASSP